MGNSGALSGSDVVWKYEPKDKKLIISGRGLMADVLTSEEYVDEDGKTRQRTVRNAPWDEFAEEAELIEFAPEVASVAPAAFFKFTALREVYMPGVAIVGSGAFYLCTNLELIQMPNVQVIGTSSFERCESLSKMLVWQEGEKKKGFIKRSKFSCKRVMSIGNYAFRSCKNLTGVSMLLCASIGKFAFCDCELLEEALFPNATQLGEGVFYNCARLEKVKLHEGCTLGVNALLNAGTEEIIYEADASGE